MANLTLKEATFFKNGTIDSTTQIVGTQSNDNIHVVRYEFVAPEKIGANKFSISKSNLGRGSGTSNGEFGFYITEDDSSYKKADGSYNHFDLTITYDNGYYIFSGECEKILLPGKTYYIWFFSTNKNGIWYYWNQASTYTAQATGTAGIVRVYNGTEWKTCICYVYDGSSWKHTIPYIYDGSQWKICSG